MGIPTRAHTRMWGAGDGGFADIARGITARLDALGLTLISALSDPVNG